MYKFIKRIADIVFSFTALILLSPLLIPIGIGLRFTGEGYIFYLQERVGYKNKIFKIFKFATMLKNSVNMKGGLITTKGDPRITPLGGILRKSKINELPQLLNILVGNMSFVGPRPVLLKSFQQYPSDIQKIIYNVKPGLTGMGSLVFRDEESLITEIKNQGKDTWTFYKDMIYPYKGELEKWYQSNQSFGVDLKILLLTAWIIFFPNTNVFSFFKDLPSRPQFLEKKN